MTRSAWLPALLDILIGSPPDPVVMCYMTDVTNHVTIDVQVMCQSDIVFITSVVCCDLSYDVACCRSCQANANL